jgi:hypothetical protein
MPTLSVRSSKDYVPASSEGHRKVLRLQDSAQYPEWSRDMKHNITTDNAWGIVLGDVKQPQKPEFDPIPTTDRQLKAMRPELESESLSDINNILIGYKREHDLREQWEIKNNKARGLILSSIVPEIENLIISEPTAKGVWDRLHAQFSDPDAKLMHDRWFTLLQAQLDVQSTTLTEYYTNLKHAVAEVNEIEQGAISNSQLTFNLMQYGDYHGRQSIVAEFKRRSNLANPEGLFKALNASLNNTTVIQNVKPTASNYYFLHKPLSTDIGAQVNTLQAGNNKKRRQSEQSDSHQNSNKRQATGDSNPQRKEKTKAPLVKCKECGMEHRRKEDGPCFYIQPEEAPSFWDKERAEKRLRAFREPQP